jgi:hypothetical protein
MGWRWLAAAGVTAAVVILTSCGTGGPGPPPATRSAAATTPLPMQSSGLAVGGDVQSQATDVAARSITEEQAKTIAAACSRTAEIANGDQPCARVMRILRPGSHPCRPLQLCIHIYDVSGARRLSDDAVIEIVDDRPGEAPCNSAPGHVCMRVGVKTSALLERIVPGELPATPSPGTATPTPTPPPTPSPSPTPQPTPSPTSLPTLAPASVTPLGP